MQNTVNAEIIEKRVQDGLTVLHDFAGWKSYQLWTKGVVLSKEELISIGYMGLHNAAVIFDENKSSDFNVFARHQISLAIFQYQRDMDVIDHRVRAEINEILKVREELSQALGRVPAIEEIADKMNKDEEYILSKLNLNPSHMDINDNDISSPMDSESKEREDIMGRDMNNCLETALKPHQRKIIELMYFNEKSAEDIVLLLRQESVIKDKMYVYNAAKNSKLKLKECMEHKGWTITDI